MEKTKTKNGKKKNNLPIEDFSPMVLKGKNAEKFERDLKKPLTKEQKKVWKKADEVYVSIKQVKEDIKTKKDKVKIVTEENFDSYRDNLWTLQKGNKICWRCWKEKPTSQVKDEVELGYPVCDDCQKKRKEVAKKAIAYWKDKQPMVRRD